MCRHCSEREVCEIVWLVAGEHRYNMTDIGLNIHSDRLCDMSREMTQHRLSGADERQLRWRNYAVR
jgi:hypothetical protein